jgi:Ca2+/Na+ antiporter
MSKLIITLLFLLFPVALLSEEDFDHEKIHEEVYEGIVSSIKDKNEVYVKLDTDIYKGTIWSHLKGKYEIGERVPVMIKVWDIDIFNQSVYPKNLLVFTFENTSIHSHLSLKEFERIKQTLNRSFWLEIIGICIIIMSFILYIKFKSKFYEKLNRWKRDD